MAEHVLNLAVLALADRECEPDVAALRAIDGGLDVTIAHAVDGDAASQRIELRLRHAAVRAHAIAPQPSGRRQFERAGEAAIVREQQQPLGIEIEASHADETRQILRQHAENGRATAGVGVRRQQAALLVIEEEPRSLAHGQRLAIDFDAVAGLDVERG